MEDFNDLEVDADDEIFFGIPEDDVDMSGIDYLWEEEDHDAVFADVRAAVQASKPSASKPSTSKPSTSSTKRKSSASSQEKGAKKSKKKNVDEPRLPCSHCTKTYANQRTLQNHLNSIVIKDLLRRAPNYDSLLSAMKELAGQAITSMTDSDTFGDLARSSSNYARKLAVYINLDEAPGVLEYITSKFLEFCPIKNAALVSSIRETFVIGTSELLNSADYRSGLIRLCRDIIECSDEVINFFVGSFTMALSNKILIFTSRTLRNCSDSGNTGPRKRSKDNFSSPRFKRLVHYIAGSVVCGIRRRRRTYPKSSRIITFTTVLNNTFVEDQEDSSTWCAEEIRKWTSTQNRGGLVFVSSKAFEFFERVVVIALSNEEEDGSLLIKNVLVKVCDDFNILTLWDELVYNALEEDVSLEWLSSIVEIVCRCVSKGIINRRLNEALGKPVSNVALRPRLAR